jgi:hypothetical protein
MTSPAGHRMKVLVHVNCICSLNAFPNIYAGIMVTPVASALYSTLLFLCHSFKYRITRVLPTSRTVFNGLPLL